MTQPENTAVLEPTAEVRRFVTAVRSRLADLTEEEREELVGGLDADMSDLVAERGLEALPDPVAYASELRSAAGFSPEAPAARGAVRERAMAWLDRGGATWNRWVATGDHLGMPAFVHSLRPAWWVLRALCATALVTEMYSSQRVFGFTFNRALVALVSVVLSVQLGRGTWRLGALVRRSLSLRLLLVALNVFAILLLPVMFNRFMAPQLSGEYAVQTYFPGAQNLTFRGTPVRNVYPYDAQGKPLVGVQLVDQDGRRLMVERTAYDEEALDETTMVPWMNGRTELFSVFPLGQQAQDPETGEPTGTPAVQPPPFSSLPPVSMAGSTPSVLVPGLTPAEKAAATRKATEARQKALEIERLKTRRSGGRG